MPVSNIGDWICLCRVDVAYLATISYSVFVFATTARYKTIIGFVYFVSYRTMVVVSDNLSRRKGVVMIADLIVQFPYFVIIQTAPECQNSSCR